MPDRHAQQVVDVADAEQVAGARLGQLLRGPADHPADTCSLCSPSVPPIASPNVSRALASWALQRRRSSSTPPWTIAYTPWPGRAVPLVPGEAAVEPPVRALGAALRVLARDVEREALVEDQRDVGVQRGLDLHRRLGAHELLGAVDVGAEADALLLDGEDRARAWRRRSGVAALDLLGDGAAAHREDLEAAGVGDHRLVPAHEAVDAAEALDQPRAPG